MKGYSVSQEQFRKEGISALERIGEGKAEFPLLEYVNKCLDLPISHRFSLGRAVWIIFNLYVSGGSQATFKGER